MSSSIDIELKIKQLYREIETLKQQQQEEAKTMSREELLKKLHSDPVFAASYFEKLNELHPYIPPPTSYDFANPPYPPLGRYQVDQFPTNDFRNINQIVYSNNPEGKAKRIKVTEIFKEKRIKAFEELYKGDPNATYLPYP